MTSQRTPDRHALNLLSHRSDSLAIVALLALATWGCREVRHSRGKDSIPVIAAHLGPNSERVPDLGAGPDTVSVRSGAWSEPATWHSGQPPGPGDVVRISAETTVIYDTAVAPRLRSVGIEGKLAFSASVSTRMRVSHLLVYPRGSLEIGTPDVPIPDDVTAEIVFNDVPLETGTPRRPGPDPEQFGVGLLVFGELTVHGAARGPSLARIVGAAGEDSFELDRAPIRWRVGDELFLLAVSGGHGESGRDPTRAHIASLDGATVGVDRRLAANA